MGYEFRNTSILDQILNPNFGNNKDQPRVPNLQLNDTMGEYGVINSMVQGADHQSYNFAKLNNTNFQQTSFYNSVVQAQNFQSGRHELGQLKLSNIKQMNDQKAGFRVASFKEHLDEMGELEGEPNFETREPDFNGNTDGDRAKSPDNKSGSEDGDMKGLEESLVKSKEISSLKVIAENNRKRSLREIEKITQNEIENRLSTEEYATNGDNMVNMSEMRPGFDFNFGGDETEKMEKSEENMVGDEDEGVQMGGELLDFSGYDSYMDDDDEQNNFNSQENNGNFKRCEEPIHLMINS